MRTRAASEKSTQTSAISVSGLSVSGAAVTSIKPSPTMPAPRAVNTMGAVRSARSNLAPRVPQRKIIANITSSATSSTPASNACRNGHRVPYCNRQGLHRACWPFIVWSEQ